MHTRHIALAQHMHSNVFSSVHCTRTQHIHTDMHSNVLSVHCTHTAHTHSYALTCILISALRTHSTCKLICTQMYSHQYIAHTHHVHADKHAHVFSSAHCTHTAIHANTYQILMKRHFILQPNEVTE